MHAAKPGSGILDSASRFAFRIKDSIRWRIVDEVVSERRIAPYLALCARLVLRKRKSFIIGVTGSVGKTTTKDMIGAVLARPEAQALHGLAVASAKNLNNDIGLPLAVLLFDDWLRGDSYRRLATLCSLPYRVARLALTSRYPDVLVLEYGTGWGGHLHHLAALAPPNIAVVTTIGPAHLERLKTLEGVAHEKSALVRRVAPDGLVVLGDDHGLVSYLERLSRAPVIKVKGRGIELAKNIARVVGRHLGIPDDAISSALESATTAEQRLNRIEAGSLTIYDDTYNANPLSMRLGLDILSNTVTPGQRRVAVLGGMRELGQESRRYHEEIGKYARSRADLVIGVGELAKGYMPDHWFTDSEACANGISHLLHEGDCVFIKGSSAERMITVVERLRAQNAATACMMVRPK